MPETHGVVYGREKKVRCHRCGTTQGASMMEPLWLSSDVVVQVCKEHGAVGYVPPPAPPTVEDELRTRIKVLEAIVDRRSDPWRDNAEERARLEAAIAAADPTVKDLKTVLREQTRLVEYAIAILDNEMYDRRVRLARAELIEALEITREDFGVESTL